MQLQLTVPVSNDREIWPPLKKFRRHPPPPPPPPPPLTAVIYYDALNACAFSKVKQHKNQLYIDTVAEKGHPPLSQRTPRAVVPDRCPRAVKQRTSHQFAQGQRSINHVLQSASIAKEYLESRYDLLTFDLVQIVLNFGGGSLFNCARCVAPTPRGHQEQPRTRFIVAGGGGG